MAADLSRPRPLLLMLLTVFVDFTGFGIMLPVLPFWAQHLGARPLAIGLTVTLFALAQFLLTPALGRLSDLVGRRPVILGSLLVQVAGYGLTAAAGSLSVLLAARFVAGLGASNVGSAQAVVSDTTSGPGRTSAMGLVGAAIGAGFVTGPALGGLLFRLGETAPIWAGLVLVLVNLGLVGLLLPETRRLLPVSASVAAAPIAGRLPLGLRRLIAVNLSLTIAFASFEAVFQLLGQRLLGWGPAELGWTYAYVGLVVILVQGGLAGAVARRFGERWVLIGGLLQVAIGLALLPFSSSGLLVLLGAGLLGAGYGLSSPVLASLVSVAAAAGRHGEALGLNQGAAAMGRTIGPLGAGALFGGPGPSVAFLAAALVLLPAVLLSLPAGDGIRPVARAGRTL